MELEPPRPQTSSNVVKQSQAVSTPMLSSPCPKVVSHKDSGSLVVANNLVSQNPLSDNATQSQKGVKCKSPMDCSLSRQVPASLSLQGSVASVNTTSSNMSLPVNNSDAKVVPVPKRVSANVVPTSLSKDGGDELPVKRKRQKLVHSNGFALNYVDEPQLLQGDNHQSQVILSLNKELEVIHNDKLDFLTCLDKSVGSSLVHYTDTTSCKEDKFNSGVSQPFRKVCIDEVFVANFPNREILKNIPEWELPSIPVCPGTYVKTNNILARPNCTPTLVDLFPVQANIYNKVTSKGLPNYLGARIQVSSFPISIWKEKLNGFHDQHVDKYISKELKHGALLGPFDSPPFDWLRVNPLMTRPKKDSVDRRVILDLSFPLGNSVNSSIDKHVYEGGPYKLRLPTPLDLAEHMANKGKGCLLFKVDLARAYRQLPSDPWDWALLGVNWANNSFVDTAIPFGVCHGAMACQRTTEALCHISTSDNNTDSEAYMDDMATVCEPDIDKALSIYNGFLDNVDELGLQVSLLKCSPPAIEMTWVEVTFNSIKMAMWIEKSKVTETLAICDRFLQDLRICKHSLQSFLGKLNHVSKLCPASRKFMNRLFDLLRAMEGNNWIVISQGAKDDVRWFVKFLESYNCQGVIRSFLVEQLSM